MSSEWTGCWEMHLRLTMFTFGNFLQVVLFIKNRDLRIVQSIRPSGAPASVNWPIWEQAPCGSGILHIFCTSFAPCGLLMPFDAFCTSWSFWSFWAAQALESRRRWPCAWPGPLLQGICCAKARCTWRTGIGVHPRSILPHVNVACQTTSNMSYAKRSM
jgi:hypothetical protein